MGNQSWEILQLPWGDFPASHREPLYLWVLNGEDQCPQLDIAMIGYHLKFRECKCKSWKSGK